MSEEGADGGVRRWTETRGVQRPGRAEARGVQRPGRAEARGVQRAAEWWQDCC